MKEPSINILGGIHIALLEMETASNIMEEERSSQRKLPNRIFSKANQRYCTAAKILEGMGFHSPDLFFEDYLKIRENKRKENNTISEIQIDNCINEAINLHSESQ